jgi:hypothetical protein
VTNPWTKHKEATRRAKRLESTVECVIAELAAENVWGPYAPSGSFRHPSTVKEAERMLRNALR